VARGGACLEDKFIYFLDRRLVGRLWWQVGLGSCSLASVVGVQWPGFGSSVVA
jgi:hypothetical protein